MIPAIKYILLAIFLSFLALRYFLRFLNLRHLGRYGAVVPPGFDGEIDPQTLGRTAAYTLAQSLPSLVESLAGNALLLAFLFGGLLPLSDRWFASLGLGFIPAGILFFLGIFLVQTAIDVPFSLYRNFRDRKPLRVQRHGVAHLAGQYFEVHRLSPSCFSACFWALRWPWYVSAPDGGGCGCGAFSPWSPSF